MPARNFKDNSANSPIRNSSYAASQVCCRKTKEGQTSRVFSIPHPLWREKKKKKTQAKKSSCFYSLLNGIRTPMGKSNVEKQAEVPFEKF